MIFKNKILDTPYTITINFKSLEVIVFYKYGTKHEKPVKVDLFGHLSKDELSTRLEEINEFYKNM